MSAAHDGGGTAFECAPEDRLHLGDARVDLAGVGHQAAEGEAGVEFDVLGADHARVLDGALGVGERVGARGVEHGPAGDAGEHLGVHLGRGLAADQFLGGGEFLPAVAPGQALGQQGALHPEPGGTQGVVRVREPVECPPGDPQRPFPLSAQSSGDGRLGHQVEVAQGVGARDAAAGRVDLGVVDGAQCGPYGVGGRVPQLHRPFQEA